MNSVRPTSGGSVRKLSIASSCGKKTEGRNFNTEKFGFSWGGWTPQRISEYGSGEYPQATGDGQP